MSNEEKRDAAVPATTETIPNDPAEKVKFDHHQQQQNPGGRLNGQDQHNAPIRQPPQGGRVGKQDQ